MKLVILGLAMVVAVAGCGSLTPRPVTQPFLRSVRQVRADGSVVAAKEKALTPFQAYMRDRVVSGSAIKDKKFSAWGLAPARVAQAVLLEAEFPESEEGYEGAYMAVLLLTDGSGRLEYFEQADHAPRVDRYFHRELTTAERNGVAAFLKAHPVETLRPKALAAESDAADTTPASGLMFRITDATAKTATSVAMADAGPASAEPAMELVKLFGALRDAASPALVCTYLRAIPIEAQVLFASPARHVRSVWADENDVRIEVLERSGESAWYALQGDQWMTTAAPTRPMETTTTRPAAATQAVVPAEHRDPAPAASPVTTEPVFPRLPKPPTTAELMARMEARPAEMSKKETWWAEPREGHTVFTHYVPRAGGPGGIMPQGESLQVIVPGLVFDSEHMALARGKGRLYVVHEGQLIVMPLPTGAR